MENENPDSFELCLLEKEVAWLEECLAEMDKNINQFLSVQNTGNCETDQEGKEKDVEDATLYLCFGSLATDHIDATLYLCFGSLATDHIDATWFAVPPRGGLVDSEVHLSPVFLERREGLVVETPFVIGSHIFLVTVPIFQQDTIMHQKRAVHYIDTQNVMEGWKGACALKTKPGIRLCHFLVAIDGIYAFEFYKNFRSLAVSFMDCHRPDRWKKVFDGPIVEDCRRLAYRRKKGVNLCLSTGPPRPILFILASTIEYAATSIDGKPGRRALIFGDDTRFTFDFDTKSCEFTEEHNFYPNPRGDGIFLDGGVIFFLTTNCDGKVIIMAYNHRTRVQCHTPVFGLDEYFPVYNTYDHVLPQLRLVHLGNNHLCLVWGRFDCGATDDNYVCCINFTINFTVEEGGREGYRATQVSSQEYKVRGSFWLGLEALFLNKAAK